MAEVNQAKKDVENQLKQAKESLHENNGKFSKEVFISISGVQVLDTQ